MDCNFVNAATRDGAILFGFDCNGTVVDCNFVKNAATDGGAIRFYSGSNGTVVDCNFVNNTAIKGGAILFSYNCNGAVTNCNFTGNNAYEGSAIYLWETLSTISVSNSCFLNNRANAAALEIIKNDNNVTIAFKGNDNLLNAIYSEGENGVTFNNVTYWGAEGISNTDSSTPLKSKNEAGQNITVYIVVNDVPVLNEVKVTDANGMIVLDISAGESYLIGARHNTDSYYTEVKEAILNNTKFNVNVTSKTTSNRTVNITAESDSK